MGCRVWGRKECNACLPLGKQAAWSWVDMPKQKSRVCTPSSQGCVNPAPERPSAECQTKQFWQSAWEPVGWLGSETLLSPLSPKGSPWQVHAWNLSPTPNQPETVTLTPCFCSKSLAMAFSAVGRSRLADCWQLAQRHRCPCLSWRAHPRSPCQMWSVGRNDTNLLLMSEYGTLYALERKGGDSQ